MPNSYRTIPLTDTAYGILREVWDSREERKSSPVLEQTLEYMDRRSGSMAKLVMRGFGLYQLAYRRTGKEQFL